MGNRTPDSPSASASDGPANFRRGPAAHSHHRGKQPLEISLVLMYTGIAAFASLATAAALARLTAGKGSGAGTVSVFISATLALAVAAVFMAPQILNWAAALNRRLQGPGGHGTPK